MMLILLIHLLFYALIIYQVYYQRQMATQRIKNIESIEQPYLRASNEITQLQVKDAHLHTTILNLKDKMQNARKDKVCKACKIFEDQIVLLKNQEKDKISMLEQTVNRLEEEKRNLANQVVQLRSREQEYFNDQQLIELSNNQEEPVIHVRSNASNNVEEVIAQQKNMLKDIEQKALILKLKEKRERQLLKNLKRMKDFSSKQIIEPSNHQNTVDRSNSLPNGHRKNQFNEGNGSHFVAANPDPEVDFNISKLEEKCSYFQELSSNLQNELNEKNKLKEQDSMRIINLLNEIQNYKNEIQNMDRFYQNQCAQLEQQKEKIVYELSSKLRAQENQVGNMKAFVEASHREKDSLKHQNELQSSEIFELKRQNGQLKISIAQSKNQLQALKQEQTSKSNNFASLSLALSKFQEENLTLSYKLAQQTQINLQNTKRCNALQDELTNLKKSHFMLESKLMQQRSTSNTDEIDYLKNILQQNNLILENKQYQIDEMTNQLASIKQENQQLQHCIRDQFSTIERAEATSSYQSDLIKTLQREKSQLSNQIQSFASEKQNLSAALQKEIDSKAQFTHKYIMEAEKLSELYKKHSNMMRQFEELKKMKNQSIQLSESSKPELHETKRLQAQITSLNNELSNLKSNINAQTVQMTSLRSQLQQSNSLKQAKEQQLELKQKQIQQIAFFNNQMFNDIEHFRNQNTFLINKLRQVEQIIYQLEQINAAASKEIEERQKQKNILQESIKNLQQQNKGLFNHSLPEKEVTLQQLNALQSELNRVRIESIEKQQKIQTQKQSNMILLQNKKQVEKINQSLLQQNKRLKTRTQQLYHEIKQLNSIKQSELSQLKNELLDKNYKIEINLSKLRQVETDLLKLQTKYDQCIQQNQRLLQSERRASQNVIYLNQKIESMTKVYESNNNNHANEELIKELNNKKQTITELLTNFKYLEKTLRKKETEFDTLTEEHQKHCKHSERQKFELHQKISTKQNEITLLKRQKDEESKRSLSKLKEMQKQIQHLQEEFKQKEKQHHDEKRQVQRQLARLTEQKRKFQQSSTREIINLKESLQTQKKKSLQSSLNSSPVKPDDSKKKEIDNLKKTVAQNTSKVQQLQKELTEKSNEINKLKQTNKKNEEKISQTSDLLSEAQVNLDIKQNEFHEMQTKNRQYQQEINQIKVDLSKKNAEVEKLREEVVLKQKHHASLQETIKNIQAKYQKLNKEQTEKNLAYDFLWMQLDEEKRIVKNLELQLNSKNKSPLINKKKSQQIPVQTDEFVPISKSLNRVPSDLQEIKEHLQAFHSNVAIPQEVEMKQVESFIEQAEKEQKHEGPISLPLTVAQQLNEANQGSGSKSGDLIGKIMGVPPENANKEEKEDLIVDIVKGLEEQVKEINKKSSGKNLIFQHTLSDALSDSEQNDEINEMLSKKDSDHKSYLQSSIEAFSEYSRIKSTKSELNHKQIEDQYKNKIKNTKLMAKLGKSKKK